MVNGLTIVMTADAVGGIWTYALDLGRGLTAQGARVVLAVLGPGPDGPSRAAAEASGLEVVELGCPPEWLASGPEEVEAAASALARLIRRTGADLLHLNHPSLGATLATDVPVLAVAHSCVATWWAAVKGTALPAMFRWQADLVGQGYRRAAALVAPSLAFAAMTQAAYGLPRCPTVIHNGRAAASQDGVNGNPVQAAFTAGRLWDEGKGAAVLDRAAALSPVPIGAAGPVQGPNGASVAFSHVAWRGVVSETELRARLAERPIYVSAALYEPFGLAVLEAAQAGCALVLSDIPTLRELWADAALFVDPSDTAGFAAAIDRLAAEPALRQRLGDAAGERAGRYTLEAQVAATVGLYDTLLAQADFAGASRPVLEASVR